MGNLQIKHSTITIQVNDLDRSIRFYENLGMQLEQKWGPHYAQLQAPGLTIGLHPNESDQKLSGSGNVSIGFTCEDFDNVKSLLSASAIQFTERTEEGGKFIHFQDPDGTALYCIEPKW